MAVTIGPGWTIVPGWSLGAGTGGGGTPGVDYNYPFTFS
jgi:hypothetical protein